MRIFLLDPGLLNQHGHHFHTDLSIYRECCLRGIEVSIFSHIDVETKIAAHLPVQPIFRASAYPSRDGAKDRCLQEDFDLFNSMVEEDLKQNLQLGLSSQDLILIPTVRDIHLTGIYKWYVKLPDPKPKVFLRFLFSPWFRVKNEERELAVKLNKTQLKLWQSLPSDQVFFSTESHALAFYYRQLTGLSIDVLPMILNYQGISETIRVSTGKQGKHLIFLGEARREKGFHLLIGAIEAVLSKYPETQFTLQASCLFDVEQAVVDRLQNLSPTIRILTEPLSTSAYNDLLLSADGVLLPYDPTQYELRTSLIFLEAVGAGKVVLVSEGTWMADEMREIGLNGVLVERFSSTGLAKAVITLLESWDHYAFNSLQAAARIRNRHNVQGCIDEMLNIVGNTKCGRIAV